MYDLEMDRVRMRLPDDWHVPVSLRAKRELSREERKKADQDVDGILLTQSLRMPRKRRHE